MLVFCLLVCAALVSAQHQCPKEPFWRNGLCSAFVRGVRGPVAVLQSCCSCPANCGRGRRGVCAFETALGRRTVVDPRCCDGTFPGQQPSAASIAVPAAVDTAAELAREIGANREVTQAVVQDAARVASGLADNVAPPNTLEKAAEIGAASAGAAASNMLGQADPGLFVAAAANGAASVAAPAITPNEPVNDFVKDEQIREQIAANAAEKVAVNELAREGLATPSVVAGVVASVDLASKDVQQKALAAAKVADAPSAPEVAANAAGAAVERVATAIGASPSEAAAAGAQAASNAIDAAQELDKPVSGVARAAVAAAAAGHAANEFLGGEEPAVFEAVAAKAAADEVVPKDPTASGFETKEQSREQAAFEGTASVVADEMSKRLPAEEAVPQAEAAGLIAAADLRLDAQAEVKQALLEARAKADVELAHSPAQSGLAAPVVAANAAADAVSAQGASPSSAIAAGNAAFEALQGAPPVRDIEQEAQLAAAASTRASAERLQRLGAAPPVVLQFASSAAASASAQVVEAEGIAVGAPKEIKADVAAHEAKVVAVAESKILGAPSNVVADTATSVLQEARKDVASMESKLASHSYKHVDERADTDRNRCIAECANRRNHAVLRCVNRCISAQ